MSKCLAIVLALCAFAAYAAADEEIYSDKYDYVDVDSILNNDRIRNQYYECFMDLAPCLTPDAKFFKGMEFIVFFLCEISRQYNTVFILLNILRV